MLDRCASSCHDLSLSSMVSCLSWFVSSHPLHGTRPSSSSPSFPSAFPCSLSCFVSSSCCEKKGRRSIVSLLPECDRLPFSSRRFHARPSCMSSDASSSNSTFPAQNRRTRDLKTTRRGKSSAKPTLVYVESDPVQWRGRSNPDEFETHLETKGACSGHVTSHGGKRSLREGCLHVG